MAEIKPIRSVKDIELQPFGTAVSRPHELGDPIEGGFVILYASNGFYLIHAAPSSHPPHRTQHEFPGNTR